MVDDVDDVVTQGTCEPGAKLADIDETNFKVKPGVGGARGGVRSVRRNARPTQALGARVPDAGKARTAVLDVRVEDDKEKQGEDWQKSALFAVRSQTPRLLVGSSNCDALKTLGMMASKGIKGNGEEKKKLREVAELHMSLMCMLYMEQIARGDCFIHEERAATTPWQMRGAEKVANLPGVHRVAADMCRFDMWSKEASNPGLLKVAVSVLTNSRGVARRMSRKCGGGHRHAKQDGRQKERISFNDVLGREVYAGLQEDEEEKRGRTRGVKEIREGVRKECEEDRQRRKIRSRGEEKRKDEQARKLGAWMHEEESRGGAGQSRRTRKVRLGGREVRVIEASGKCQPTRTCAHSQA